MYYSKWGETVRYGHIGGTKAISRVLKFKIVVGSSGPLCNIR
jgi:hypothetical protein